MGHSSQQTHTLTGPSWRPLGELARWFHEKKDVPLRRPDGWLDNCSDIKTILASNNTRRLSRRAIGFRGFLGHIDIPDQSPTWHWDPGALNYSALFQEVEDMSSADIRKGYRSVVQGEPAPPDASLDFMFGRNLAEQDARARRLPKPTPNDDLAAHLDDEDAHFHKHHSSGPVPGS